MYSTIVTDHWRTLSDDSRPGTCRVSVDEHLPAKRSVSLLRLADGRGSLSLTPEHAATLGLAHDALVGVAEVSAALAEGGIVLNDPDHLFYLPTIEQGNLLAGITPAGTRQLTEADAEAFADFTRSAPEEDLDEAFVELDHWIVYGTFVDSRLVAAASMIRWEGTRLADLGVVALPTYRGRGLAKRTVQALCRAALLEGYEPQYRCQLDNAPSVALAASSGFSRLGQWEVVRGSAA